MIEKQSIYSLLIAGEQILFGNYSYIQCALAIERSSVSATFFSDHVNDDSHCKSTNGRQNANG